MSIELLEQPGTTSPGTRYVPVGVPADVDPAVVASAIQAVEKALVMLVAAGQEQLISRADHLAEMATGLLEPGSELLEDRVRRMQTLRQVFAEGDWLSAEQINALQVQPPRSKSQPASDWKRRGRIFGVSYGGREFFARYQFDAMYQPLPIMRDVLAAWGEVPDPWVLAAWFHYPNSWLADEQGRPVAPKDALDRKQALLHAVRARQSSYVA